MWYQVESICREVAYLRTLLQSKHRQLQELVNSQERAQTYQHRWEKVRYNCNVRNLQVHICAHANAMRTRIIFI